MLGYLTQLRKAQGLAPRLARVQPAPPVTDPTVQCLTPRQPTDMTTSEQHLLARLPQAHAAFAPAIALAQGFAQFLRPRRREAVA